MFFFVRKIYLTLELECPSLKLVQYSFMISMIWNKDGTRAICPPMQLPTQKYKTRFSTQCKLYNVCHADSRSIYLSKNPEIHEIPEIPGIKPINELILLMNLSWFLKFKYLCIFTFRTGIHRNFRTGNNYFYTKFAFRRPYVGPSRSVSGYLAL